MQLLETNIYLNIDIIFYKFKGVDLMMIRASIVGKITKSNKTYLYKVKGVNGEVRDFVPEQLKAAIKNGSIQLDNYKLTSDNRLIPCKINTGFPTFGNVYILMNKDTEVAKFDTWVGFMEVHGKLPYACDSINDWIEARKKFSCARDVKIFFKSIGIEDVADFIDITHCVSLQDTFWVKRENSKLNWNNVSPFRNNYSNVISTYALEGIYLGNNEKNYFSPVMSTNGSFPHTWKFKGSNIYFIKAGSKYTLGGSNSGREPFSEYYASKVARYLGFNCVDYNIRNHLRHDKKVDTVTECKSFTTESIGSVTAHNLGLDSYESVIEYSKKLSDKAYNTCIDMLFLDCLLLNTDRHFSNIEFLMNNDTLEIIDMAPIFDNNYSLLPRFIDGLDKFNREDYTVRDGRTFDNLYNLVKKHKNYRNKLIALKNFNFEQPEGNITIPEKRLAFLNWFLQEQVNYLLKM